MENQEQQAIAYAAQIVALAETGQYDFTAIFNGLAIAAGSFIADYSIRDGQVDGATLALSVDKFKSMIDATTEFACSQVHLINENT